MNLTNETTLYALRSLKTGKFIRLNVSTENGKLFYKLEDSDYSERDFIPIWTTSSKHYADSTASSRAVFQSPYPFQPTLNESLYGHVEVVELK